MKAKRTHISQAGETAREAVRGKKLLVFLENDTPAWKDVDHPEQLQRVCFPLHQ
jgi:hypothetical protein